MGLGLYPVHVCLEAALTERNRNYVRVNIYRFRLLDVLAFCRIVPCGSPLLFPISEINLIGLLIMIMFLSAPIYRLKLSVCQFLGFNMQCVIFNPLLYVYFETQMRSVHQFILSNIAPTKCVCVCACVHVHPCATCCKSLVASVILQGSFS